MKTRILIAAPVALFWFMAAPVASTPHQLSDNARQTASEQDTRRTTIARAKQMEDGASVKIQGVLEQKLGRDLYRLRDDSGTLNVVIPGTVLGDVPITATDPVVVSGALDKKQNPFQLRVSYLEKP
ncbi:NirD/YgiW/YdeI family stress tolerance protein [Erwinia sp. CPCC 100877]|nr:NirD/YgiW/YdeI family stress tolerance protein [Erwinia sp. CPCC 100877]